MSASGYCAFNALLAAYTTASDGAESKPHEGTMMDPVRVAWKSKLGARVNGSARAGRGSRYSQPNDVVYPVSLPSDVNVVFSLPHTGSSKRSASHSRYLSLLACTPDDWGAGPPIRPNTIYDHGYFTDDLF